ncbi:MAG: helix-turn-helix domain-containing protein [Clostridia bacterium]|nr:helix-turn-helix domain-containing protein [Clostridia bacterium]
MSELNVLWIGKYSQDWEMESHCHSFFQIFGVIGGKGSILIEEEPFGLEKETLYIIPPDHRHVIIREDLENLPKMLDIKFEVLDNQLDRDLKRISHPIQISHFDVYSHQFDKMLEESMYKEPYYYHWINAFFYCLLVRIIRENLYHHNSTHESQNRYNLSVPDLYLDVDIKAVLQYIYDHYTRPISLDQLARIAAVNKTKLINVFKDIIGTTPIQYINQLRLRKARELLINTDINIGEIARLSGFQNIHYFSRYFQSKENCSPRDFRKKNKNNRFFDL